ncbi:MAG: 2,3-diphosphoglycerate-dependent phosphoglycerate mutase [Lentimicrobiaceae bacterium]|jgi:2,3-bisphosphoglycerate-dependent phosphoglycerate mutase|nr:2,3-diphosphoglycerate-dependent phosphoglycerate mutase [Lentimicrobiaceae bacterium]
MKRLVLIRHGESIWNKENRFTGWTDVPLSTHGIAEATRAGKEMKKEGFRFKKAYASYLSRAIKTLWICLEEMDQMYIPVVTNWCLNEKHYGVLQGLNKTETAEQYGDEQVLLWRRSFDVAPAPLEEADLRSPVHDPRYDDIDPQLLPLTESLKDVVSRMIPYWYDEIRPEVEKLESTDDGEILIAAHGNSLRALVMHLKNMSETEIIAFNIPTAVPYVFEFDDQMNLIRDYFIGDPEEIKTLMAQVANQGKAKK